MSGRPSKRFDPNEQRLLSTAERALERSMIETLFKYHMNSPASWGYGAMATLNPSSLNNTNGAKPKPMTTNTKFKPGDRVEVTKDATGGARGFLGQTGTVREHTGEGCYAVEFDEDIPGDISLHDCGGSVSSGLGWIVGVQDMQLIVKTVVDFDSVVIEDHKRDQILEALEQVNQSDLIFKTWGFGKTIEKGKGVSMLFYGQPGTGKTLMAQAIASKLDYTLKIISTADIESSKPGESERNIRKHFKDAKGGKTILLFDECDSLIYHRGGVGPIMGAQINELLSQIERFNGITLFTTNRLGTLDEAMNRRLALKLEFSMPTQEQRAEIWKRMFPEEAPVHKDVDWKRLAIVELTGGYIKNAVLRAARMAAIQKLPDTEKEIKMEHLVKSLKLETESMMAFDKARQKEERRFSRPVIATGLDKVRGAM